jgi:hypothetical protein
MPENRRERLTRIGFQARQILNVDARVVILIQGDEA